VSNRFFTTTNSKNPTLFAALISTKVKRTKPRTKREKSKKKRSRDSIFLFLSSAEAIV